MHKYRYTVFPYIDCGVHGGTDNKVRCAGSVLFPSSAPVGLDLDPINGVFRFAEGFTHWNTQQLVFVDFIKFIYLWKKWMKMNV